MFSFKAIFRQAWQITKTHKFLWLFSLFFVYGNFTNLSGNWQYSDWASFAITGAFVILFILSLRAQAGAIASIKALIDKQETFFKRGWAASRLFYLRLFYINLILLLGLMILGIILGPPVVYLAQQHQLAQAWILGIFGGLIFLAAAIPVAMMSVLGPILVVVFDLKVHEALDRSFALIQEFFWRLVRFGLVMLILWIAPVVILDFLPYYIHGLMVQIVAVILVSLIQIILATFAQTAWILVLLELVKPQKFAEEKELPVPEIV